MKIAFIAGTSIKNSKLFESWTPDWIETSYGIVEFLKKGNTIIINRHSRKNLPPHNINYHGNISALAHLGYTDVISINSVGSLKHHLRPGSIVSCSDYVCLQQSPKTFYNDKMGGVKSGISNNLLPDKQSCGMIDRTHRVYVQMAGPRFETKAEVRVIKSWGDVVGMTAAHEADLCGELGINYNSLAIIDNYANDINDEEINFDKFDKLVLTNQLKVDRLLTRLLEIFA